MPGEKPPVFRSAVRAYRDTTAAIAAMPAMAMAGLAISMVYGLLDYFITDLGYSSRPFGLIIDDNFISRPDIFSSLIVKIKT